MSDDHDYIDIICPDRKPPSDESFGEMRVIARDAEIERLKAELDEARSIIAEIVGDFSEESGELHALYEDDATMEIITSLGKLRRARAFIDKAGK